MRLHFYIHYATVYGESIQLAFEKAGSDLHELNGMVTMEYLDEGYWHTVIDTANHDLNESFRYSYVLQKDGENIQTLKNIHSIPIKKQKQKVLIIVDEWKSTDLYTDIFAKRPFKKLIKSKTKALKKATGKNSTHHFIVKCMPLAANLVPCLIGSALKMNQWSEEKPLLMSRYEDGWALKLNLHKEKFPIEFKVALYDVAQKKLLHYEPGVNRILSTNALQDHAYLYHIQPDFGNFAWRGAGVNFPVSGLKTNNSWGIGDFTDLLPMIDWAKSVGLKLIQLLPVNDTSATHTRKDSYPYSAISAFALHPGYLNVHKLATAFSLPVSETLLEEVKKLNALQQLDYEAVIALKLKLIRELYDREKHFFKDDFDWFEFFEMNRHWLSPYAAFCYLRDKYNTADFSQWGEYAVYNEDEMLALTAVDTDHYNEIAIHYFTQYHLHLQLRDATDHAHKSGIVLKADLPIGVGRNSVDTWMYPQLFHLDMQAGAPPDAFAKHGQNWSFPTYNWQRMATDNYAWWRQRMEQLSNYFDAVRIDHVLGFFRIWSIPVDAVQGILGKFVPAKALQISDFEQAGLHWDEDRLCSPYFNDEMLYGLFGDKTDWIKQTFLEYNRFKPAYNTQRSIALYFEQYNEHAYLQDLLFGLLADVVLIKDAAQDGFHFRFNIFETNSYKSLPANQRVILNQLYDHYFFSLQNEVWKQEGISKINALKNASNNMLLCAEDLGMVPEMVPEILHQLEILSLQVERMPKKSSEEFALPSSAPYDTVITSSTHDMSTVREWWEEDHKITQHYFNRSLGHYGEAPYYCEPNIAAEIIIKHLQAPAMWTVFLIQDLLASNAVLRRENPTEERINIPADPEHYWNFRMHIPIETLVEATDWNNQLEGWITASKR